MVRYEWDIETVTNEDTEEYEAGEVMDHNHRDDFADTLWCVEAAPPEGMHYEVVLVRDDDEGRSWAYLTNGRLGSHFLDAYQRRTRPVPQRFRIEVARHAPSPSVPVLA